METTHGGQRRRGCYRVPLCVDPLVRQFFELLNLAGTGGATLGGICARAGISTEAARGWRTARSPNLGTLQAALNVLGYELRVVRRELGDHPGAP